MPIPETFEVKYYRPTPEEFWEDVASTINRDGVTVASDGDPPSLGSAAKRTSFLDEAKQYITKDRNTAHGEPESNLTNIARMWEEYLKQRYAGPKSFTELDGNDVAVMMALMKIVRHTYNPTHRDNIVDGVGYLAIAGELAGSTE